MRNFTEKQVLKIIEHLETKGFNDDCLTYEEELEHILKQPLVKNIEVIPCCEIYSDLLLRDCSTCGTYDIADCNNCTDFDNWRKKQ